MFSITKIVRINNFKIDNKKLDFCEAVGDFARLSKFWLADDGTAVNDYYERSDGNQDGIVDMTDLINLITNWTINN